MSTLIGQIAGMLRLAAVAAAVPIVAAAQGSITGRVTDAQSGTPIPSVQVSVIGSSAGALTNEDGRYTIRSVGAGRVELRALRIGFQERKVAADVVSGQVVTADFTMRVSAVSLAPIVTTATGDTRREEIGNSIAQVNAAKLVAEGPVANMTDLLTARAPSIQVLNSTTTGGGARVRIRGTSSLSLSNEPIYVIDGVRMTSNVSSISNNIFTGGSAPSRVGDLNPEEIESIEVVRGPSAATLYGTDAANGVIVISTKRGRAGKTQYNVYAEQGWIKDFADYPTAYTIAGNGSSDRLSRICTLPQVSAGACSRDSVFAFNIFETDDVTPLATGSRYQYGAQIMGGSEAVRFFTSAEFEEEVGIQTIPKVDLRRADSIGFKVREEFKHPNSLKRASVRANLNASLSPKSDLAVSTAFIRSTTFFAQSENNAGGLLSSAFGGPGYRNNGTGLNSGPRNGYRAYTPLDIYQNVTDQNVNRVLVSGNLSWRPLEWLSGRAVVGADVTNRKDTELCRRGQCPNLGSNRLGFKTDNRATFYNYTVDLGATAVYQLLPDLGTKTTVGTQYVNYRFDGNGTYVSNLPVGTSTTTAGSVREVANEFTTASKTLGVFVEEGLAFRDRLFVTGALRSDQNSAFGTDFQSVLYPKLQVSWILSEEPFVPRQAWLTQFRLRGAYGASGTQPGPNDALRFFSPSTVSVDRLDQPAVQFNTLGNDNLKPERSTEGEIGFELRLLDDRVSYDFNYFSKLSKDALIGEVIPPSLGTGATTRLSNLGAVKNYGFENIVRARILDGDALGIDMQLTYSTVNNTLVDVGPVPFPPGTIIRQVVGYPVNGYWGRKLRSYADANGDGIITVNEIVVDSVATFIGSSQPTREGTLNTTVELLKRSIRVGALFDYKGGFIVRNGTERIRCQNRTNCAGVGNPEAPLFEQARAVALRDHPARTSAAYNEKGDFVRFRELSLTYSPPERWSSRLFSADRVSLTGAIRNVYLWTDYSGLDPESNYGQDDVQNDFQTLPPPTYFTVRINVGF